MFAKTGFTQTFYKSLFQKTDVKLLHFVTHCLNSRDLKNSRNDQYHEFVEKVRKTFLKVEIPIFAKIEFWLPSVSKD